MKNAKLEIIRFDAQDVIATSTTGGGVNAIKFVLSKDLYTDPYGEYDFLKDDSGTVIYWYSNKEKENFVGILALGGDFNENDTVYLDAANTSVLHPNSISYGITAGASADEIAGAVEKKAFSEIVDWIKTNNLLKQ